MQHDDMKLSAYSMWHTYIMLCLLRERWHSRHGACDPRLAHPGIVAGNGVEASVRDIAWRHPHAHVPREAQVQVQIHGGHIAEAWERNGSDVGDVNNKAEYQERKRERERDRAIGV